jgi:subtilisin family serine protease
MKARFLWFLIMGFGIMNLASCGPAVSATPQILTPAPAATLRTVIGPTIIPSVEPIATNISSGTPSVSLTPAVPSKQDDSATPTRTPLPPKNLDFQPPPSFSDLANQYPELYPMLSHSEIDSVYKEFVVKYRQENRDAALKFAQERGILEFENYIRAELTLDITDGQSVVSSLEALGNDIRTTNVSPGRIEILVSLSLVDRDFNVNHPGAIFVQIADLAHVIRVGQIEQVLPASFAGDIDDEGVVVTGADIWQQAGYMGQGVRIGIIDPGFSGYQRLLGGELPLTVTARSFGNGGISGGGEVHGTACAEIIHDMAPDAELFFAQANTLSSLSAATDWLIAQHVNIISHSAGFFSGPMDGSGPAADVVNRAAANEILWVNAAGNYSDQHYRFESMDSDHDHWIDFPFGGEALGFEISSPQSSYASITLNWDDWSSMKQDYDLYVLDSNFNIIASSTDWQTGNRWPSEYLQIYLPAREVFYIAAYAKHTDRMATLDIYFRYVSLSHTTPDHSLITPADAAGALAVGATYWWDDALTEYSSQGPTTDGRLKPEITAPTNVSNASYGIFGGTSASAPHVAGAAALVLSAFPNLKRADLANYLEVNALDLGATGSDNQFGYGRVQLPDPRSQVPAPNPTRVPQLTVTPNIPSSITLRFPYIGLMSGSVNDHGVVSSVIYPGDAELPYDYQGFITFDVSQLPFDASILSAEIDTGGCYVRGNPFVPPPGGLGNLSIWTVQYNALTKGIYTPPSGDLIADFSNCPSGSIEVTDVLKGYLGQHYFQLQLTFPATSDDGEIDDITLLDPVLIVVFSRP